MSVNRDYVLLIPAAKDTEPADLPRKRLEQRSAESVGTTHPAVLLLLGAPEKLPDGPSMVNDPMLNTWGAIVSIPLEVKGEGEPRPLADSARRGRGEDGLRWVPSGRGPAHAGPSAGHGPW